MEPSCVSRLLEPFRKRMNDISIFIKELKGRFAQWYNRRYGRYGALWAERFKSVLLEGGQAVAAIAAYIDLNPVRAGLCEDPKEYRYCGYAEAVAKGTAVAMEGIRVILGLPKTTSPEQVAAEYRKHLFLSGAVGSKNHPPAFDQAKAQAVVEQEKGEALAPGTAALQDSLLQRWSHPGKSGFCGIPLPAAGAKDRLQAQERPNRLKDLRSGDPVGLSQSASPQIRIGILRFPTRKPSSSTGTDAFKGRRRHNAFRQSVAALLLHLEGLRHGRSSHP